MFQAKEVRNRYIHLTENIGSPREQEADTTPSLVNDPNLDIQLHVSLWIAEVWRTLHCQSELMVNFLRHSPSNYPLASIETCCRVGRLYSV